MTQIPTQPNGIYHYTRGAIVRDQSLTPGGSPVYQAYEDMGYLKGTDQPMDSFVEGLNISTDGKTGYYVTKISSVENKDILEFAVRSINDNLSHRRAFGIWLAMKAAFLDPSGYSVTTDGKGYSKKVSSYHTPFEDMVGYLKQFAAADGFTGVVFSKAYSGIDGTNTVTK